MPTRKPVTAAEAYASRFGSESKSRRREAAERSPHVTQILRSPRPAP